MEKKDPERPHLSRILEKKIERIELIEGNKINNKIIESFKSFDCLIIDDFNYKTDENLLYSLLNQSNLLDKYILINSIRSLQNINFKLPDLKSRINRFIFIGI